MFKAALDQAKIYQKYDQLHVYDSILGLKNQVSQAWLEVSHLVLKNKFTDVRDIVFSGMGGSALGGRIIRSLDQYLLNRPMEVVTNYRLPAYVDKESLVLLSSYSGNTEETLSAALDAIQRQTKIFIVASGGKLLDLAKKKGLDHYAIDPKFNPSGQPRLGLGYSVISQFAFLSRLKLINFNEEDVDRIIALLEKLNLNFGKDQKTQDNPAKIIADKLQDRAVILIGANHLVGTIHAVKNMLNENSKTFAAHFDLPELNHHFLEGLGFPKALKDVATFVFFNSDLYPAVIRKRLTITRQMLERLGFQTVTIKPESDHPTLQAFECLAFGEFVSFYLALLSHLDPGPIPSIDYFKKELARL